MKPYFLLLLFCFILISGCATRAQYVAILKTWVGTSERELIEIWGSPDSVYELSENEKMLSWEITTTMTLSGTNSYKTTVIGNTMYTGLLSPSEYNLYCKTTFIIRDRIIVDWQLQGNNCVAY